MGSNKRLDPVLTQGTNRVQLNGSFRPNGTSAVVSGGTTGQGFTVARTSLGLYTVTFRDKYPSLISATASIRDTSGRGVAARIGDYDDSAKTLKIYTMVGAPRFIPIDLFSAREIAANDFQNTAADAGMLSKNTTPILERINAATDIAARISWAAGNSDEIQFPPIPMPPEAVASGNAITVNGLFSKNANVDTTTTVAIKAFLGIGDTNAGGNTTALNVAADTLVQKSVSIATADVAAYPSMLNLSMVPGTHASDIVRLHALWLEMATLYDMTSSVDNTVNFSCVFRNTSVTSGNT